MDKMREEFEAWWRATMNTVEMDLHRFVDGYSCHDTNRAWMAWQASRAALCVELPSFENGSLRGYNGDCNEANMVIDCIADSLDEAGVRYK